VSRFLKNGSHMFISPVDNRLILYNNEWPSDCGIRRVWLWEEKHTTECGMRAKGRSKDDWTCHEMWQRDGKVIIYHGSYKNGLYYIGRINPDGTGRVEIPFPQGWKRYGHFTEGAQNMIITDGYYTQSTTIQFLKPPRAAFGYVS